jgi:esterase/lipase
MQKQIVLLDDCYHVITVDRQRQAVVTHLKEFFRLSIPAPAPETIQVAS